MDQGCIVYAEAEEAEAEEAEADETDETETDETEEAELDTSLSLKQREHGATRNKSLSDEADKALYDKLYQIVEETRRRNEARSHALTRTPTSSSLDKNNSDDEYADMPPLVYATAYTTPKLRNRRANIFDHNTLYMKHDDYSDMPALEPNEPHIMMDNVD